MMCALISADVLVDQRSIDCSPARIRARASRTQVGHSESVVRGQPSCGRVRSVLFISGAGAHFGWNGRDVELPVDGLKGRPCEPRAVAQRQFDRSPQIHPESLLRGEGDRCRQKSQGSCGDL